MTRHRNSNRTRLLLAEWPAADRGGWLTALQPGDPFEPEIGYARKWKPTTQKLIEEGYGYWLSWLAQTGALDLSSTAVARTTRSQVRAYLEMLQDSGLAPYTVALRLRSLGNGLSAIAPEAAWNWVLRAAERLHCRATPSRDRAAILQPAADVLTLGYDLMQAAEQDRFRTTLDRATLFRDGLIITSLAHRPLRSRNFHNLTIGKNLQRRGEGWVLEIDKAETKTGHHIEAAWPDALVAPLERYIAVHRPALLTCSRKDLPPTEMLWISMHGTPMTAAAIAFQIKSRTEGEFGTAINPHSFRHLAATTIATDDPDGVIGIQSVLGHTSDRSGQKHYNKAKTVDAGRRYLDTLAAFARRS